MKPTTDLSEGMIFISQGHMTPKEAITFVKELKKTIREAKSKYCAHGHLITEKTSKMVMLRGYMIRRCLICKAKYDAEYYAADLGGADARPDSQ